MADTQVLHLSPVTRGGHMHSPVVGLHIPYGQLQAEINRIHMYSNDLQKISMVLIVIDEQLRSHQV